MAAGIGALQSAASDNVKALQEMSRIKKLSLFISLFLLFDGASLSLLWAQKERASSGSLHIQSVGPIAITVSNLRESLLFYTKVLAFKKLWISEVYGKPWEELYGIFGLRVRTARLRLGREIIHLNEFLTPEGRPIPVPSRSNDLWFQHIAIVVSNMEKAYRHLRKHGVAHVSTSPQRIPDWNKSAAGIKAFYFRDPDRHVLEIIYFPPGKGEPRWQRKKAELFLGIDHTAIAVFSTQRSLAFYRDMLGMKKLGGSLNYGIEQARLNNVKDARVQITTLKGKAGPAIEFLHYLRPGPGRLYPRDTQASDIWHWHSVLYVENVLPFWELLRKQKSWLVSARPVTLNKTLRGYKRAFLARDPDGHALLFVEERE